jgi:caa(3)-type oxidase subunit IV
MTKGATSHSSPALYIRVFAALATLTALTVGLAYAHLPHRWAIGAASLIAGTKAALIGYFFMHLRSEGRGIYGLLFTGVFLVLFLLVSLLPDVGYMIQVVNP